MESLWFAFNALTPLIIIALLGYLLRIGHVLNDDFIATLNKYVFYVALPVLIFTTIIANEDVGDLAWGVVWFSIVMLFVITFAGLFLLYFIHMDKPHKIVVLQAFFRGNFVLIGIPLTLRIGGQEALGMIIVLNVFLIPITNLLSIIAFQLWNDRNRFSLRSMTKLMTTTFKNPLMIALMVAFVFLFFSAPWVFISTHINVIPETLDLISVTATPLALIAVGGQFRVKRVKALSTPLIIATVGRLMVVPLVVFTAAYIVRNVINFSDSWPAVIAVFASPVAVSSVAVTRGLNGDDELASQIVVWTTVLAVFTLFVMVALFRAYGLL